MKKEKIQKIFIYLIVFIILLSCVFVGYYFYYNHKKWQDYKNDENKSVFYERVLEYRDKVKREATYENYLDLGNAYYGLGEYNLAIKAYSEMLKLANNRDILAYENIANTYKDSGNYKKSEETYLKLISVSPGAESAYVGLYDLYKNHIENGEYDEESIIKLGIESNPESFNLTKKLAYFYADVGQIEKAIEYYEKALEINPGSELVKNELNRLKK